ncbi:Hsp20 family protein [Liberibacter sp. Z1]|nr:Hsp20 family protein [Candidatus Liberibacter sp.]
MRVNFSPFYSSTVGYEPIFSMLDGLGRPEQASSYPPYDIERIGDNAYRIILAVAGFDASDLNIEVDSSMLIIKGEKQSEDKETVEYLHRGIAKRAFERRFQLADFVEVTSASLQNGLLHLELLRSVPEKMKPRRIEIVPSLEKAKILEGQKAVPEKTKSFAA